MKVHHLNLGTMCPFGGRWVSGGQGSVVTRAELVLHVLLLETERDGLVLVDTGIGLDDVRSPRRRLGGMFVTLAQPRLRESDTAARQIERLGFSRKDVRHIVITHLDCDHAGGIVDFPEATVHVHGAEQRAATAPTTFMERNRYRADQLSRDPKWKLHDAFSGERWFGFENVRAIGEDVLLLPLPGHTRGHSVVAVRAAEALGPEWLLHCGDAYFHETEKEDEARCPPGLRVFQRLVAVDDRARRANAARLRALHRDHAADVRLFSAHDPAELAALAGSSA